MTMRFAAPAAALVACALAGCGDDASGGAAGATTTSSGAGGTGSTTTGDGGAGAGTTSGGGGNAGAGGGGRHPGLVPMFVAHGHVGRTTISCDDGKTWVADQSDDDAYPCFTAGNDCDHHPGAANGITWGDGWFFATYGWGMPGSVRRSHDGVSWEKVVEGTTFGGMAFGEGTVLAGARAPRRSLDDGASWADLGDVDMTVWNVREVGHVPHDGGRFLLVGSDGDVEDMTLSSDQGQTWWKPTTLPASCGISFYASGGTAYGAGAIVVADGSGTACRSTDGGTTWETVTMPSGFESTLVWTGAEFVAWAQGTMLRSSDGATWTTTPTTPPDLALGPVARSDGGTFVAVRGGWDVWYDKQRFYRSADGITWEELPPGAFKGGHPIRAIEFGWAEPSADCPSM